MDHNPNPSHESEPRDQAPVDPAAQGKTEEPGDVWTPDDAVRQPPGGGVLGDHPGWLIWFLAGALILAALGCGLFLFSALNSRGRAAATLPSTRTALPAAARFTPTATRRPTATPTASATPTPTRTPTVTPTPTPTPDVILLGVQALGELSTVEYNLETVVDKEAQQSGMINIGNIEIWRPRLHFLLVAGGRVKAGVDFGEMVRYEIVDAKVTVFLPAPRITDYAIDPQNLRVYYIHTSFGLDEKFAVEKYNEAVVEAQENLRRAALESDILDVAKTNATALIQSLVFGLGFSDVEVEFLSPIGDETEPLEIPLELMLTPAPFITATPGG